MTEMEREISFHEIQPYIRFVNNYKPGYSYTEQERILFDHELMHIMEGEVDMFYDGRKYSLHKGDTFYLKPFVKNHIVVEESSGFRTHCVHFDWMMPKPEENFTAEEYYMHSVISSDHNEKTIRLMERTVFVPAGIRLPDFIARGSDDGLSGLFVQCYSAFCESGPASVLKMKGLFFEIVALLLERSGLGHRGQPMHPGIRHGLKYIKDHYTEDISVVQLAGKCNLSPKYFGALFKASAGKSVGEYILDLRMYDAKEMLIGTDLSVEEIAERVGFHNSFYFSKCFRLKEKVTPTKYRSIMRLQI